MTFVGLKYFKCHCFTNSKFWRQNFYNIYILLSCSRIFHSIAIAHLSYPCIHFFHLEDFFIRQCLKKKRFNVFFRSENVSIILPTFHNVWMICCNVIWWFPILFFIFNILYSKKKIIDSNHSVCCLERKKKEQFTDFPWQENFI